MATTLTLGDAAGALGTVNDWIEEHGDEILANGGALTPELQVLLDQAEGDLKTKVARVVMKIRELEAAEGACKAEKKRLDQREKTHANAAASLKRYLLQSLLLAGEPSVKTPLVSVRVQESPAAVQVGDARALLAVGLAKLGEPVPTPIVVDRAAVLAKHERVLAEAQAEAAALELDAHERNNVEAGVRLEAEVDGVTDAALIAEQVAERLAKRLAEKQSAHVKLAMSLALPGVAVTRGHHVVIR